MSKAKRVEWKGFINVYLRPNDKAAIKQNPIDDSGIIGLVEGLTNEGYKVSLTYSDRGSFYTATVYGNTAGHINAGYALSIRHSDYYVAFSALNYIFDNIGLGGGWEENYGSTQGNNDW